jgi:hypothetical protein
MDGTQARARGLRRAAVPALCVAAAAFLGVQLWSLMSKRQAIADLRAKEAALATRRAAGEKDLSRATEARRRAAEEAEAADLSRFPPAVQDWVRRLEDPRYFQAAQYRRGLDRDYAALFRELHLPQGKLDALRDLLAERFKAEEEVLRLAPQDGLFLDDLPERGALLAAGTKEADEQIRALLGDEGYAAFVQYQGSIQTRRFAIAPFAEHERSGPNALTDSQVDQLAASVPPYYFGVEHFIFQEPAPPLPASLDEAAAAALTPPQLAAYNAFKDYWQAKRAQAEANQDEVRRQIAAKEALGH